ncbi:hypothetical protein [Mycobacterium sp. 1164966.3]|uniref:hypothetical protein n=1 Tax=Mycobacterium sp. 1164966.3 TaxID=1856861 RepID=UPI001C12C2A5|nr:hypothetical protein [Mycobacterium sp. 1164966.3]
MPDPRAHYDGNALGYSFSPPAHARPRKRSTADTVATVILFTLLLLAIGLSVAVSLLPSLSMMMPICSDNCDSPEITRLDHQVKSGVAMIWIAAIVAVLVAGTGTVVAGVRRWVMWIWPTLGLAIVVVSFVIAGFTWLDAIPSGA